MSSSLSPTVLYLVLQSFTINNPHYVALVQDKFHPPVLIAALVKIMEDGHGGLEILERNVRRKCNPTAFNPQIWPSSCPAAANEEEGRDFLLLQQLRLVLTAESQIKDYVSAEKKM